MLGGILFVMGVLVGGYGTLIGAGGGFLLMPLLLVLFPGEGAAALTRLSLSVVALNAASGTVAYARQRRIDYRLAAVLAVVVVPASMIGAFATRFLPRTAFEVLFGLTLLVLGAVLVRGPLVARHAEVAGAAAAPRRVPLGLGLSAVVGWLAGVLGIGGAPPQIVVLTHVMRVPVARAMPTVQCLVMVSAAGAAAVQYASGDALGGSLAAFLPLGGGALLGAQLGAAISRRLSGAALVRLLASALLFVGVGLLARALG